MEEKKGKKEKEQLHQLKILKQALVEERKKGVQFKEKNEALMTKMMELSNPTGDIREELMENNKELQELIEEKMAEQKEKVAEILKAEAAKAPPRELIAEKERMLEKAQTKLSKWSESEKELLSTLERVEQEQSLLSSQFKVTSDELNSRYEMLSSLIEQKKIAHEEELEKKDVECNEIKKKIEELDLEIRKWKIRREEEHSEITRAQLELERVEGNLHELEVSIATKTNYLNQLDRILKEHVEENGRLAMKLIDMKSILLEYESQIRVYPAAELRKKQKILVNLRFYKTEDQQYCLEVANLKECRSYNIVEIDIHVDKQGCLQIVFEKYKGKMELYECEYSNEIYEAFLEYRKMAADLEERGY